MVPLGEPAMCVVPSAYRSEESDTKQAQVFTSKLFPPPGFTLARAASLSASSTGLPASGVLDIPPLQNTPPAAIVQAPGICVTPAEVASVVCTRVEWTIEDVRGKLHASMGRPLVSPRFAACGLPNLRLMVFPDPREAVKGVRSRDRKGMYASMVRKGPLYGALKLKADCLKFTTMLRFHLTVGAVRRGPFVYNFAECAIHGCDDFGIDWLKHVDESCGSLRVGIEIYQATGGTGTTARQLANTEDPHSSAD